MKDLPTNPLMGLSKEAQFRILAVLFTSPRSTMEEACLWSDPQTTNGVREIRRAKLKFARETLSAITEEYPDIDADKVHDTYCDWVAERAGLDAEGREILRWSEFRGSEAGVAPLSPAELIDAYKRGKANIPYEGIAAEAKIGKATLYDIRFERRLCQDETYKSLAAVIGCDDKDLLPRNLAPKVEPKSNET
jgi:hypothetical protein